MGWWQMVKHPSYRQIGPEYFLYIVTKGNCQGYVCVWKSRFFLWISRNLTNGCSVGTSLETSQDNVEFTERVSGAIQRGQPPLRLDDD